MKQREKLKRCVRNGDGKCKQTTSSYKLLFIDHMWQNTSQLFILETM